MDKASLLPRYALTLVTLLFSLLLPGLTFATSSLLIWPVNPVIEQDQQAAALWLENKGTREAFMQVRVFAWRQVEGREAFDSQQDIIISPPMLSIAPGQKQLIRITRLKPPQPRTEAAYRIIIDEIPTAGDKRDDSVVTFQMRYSLPLFSYGDGLYSVNRAQSDPRYSLPLPRLSWRKVSEGGQHYFEVINRSEQHARLTETALLQQRHTLSENKALQGYVLANSRMRWLLPEGASGATTLRSAINGSPPETIEFMP